MNTRYLFAKLSGLAVLIAFLCVAVPVARQRFTIKQEQPAAPPTVPSQPVPASQPVSEKPHAISRAALPSTPANAPTQQVPVAIPVSMDTSPGSAQQPQLPDSPQEESAPQPQAPPIQQRAIWQSQDGVRVATFHLLAGQELDLSDPQYNFVKIESDFPLNVQCGRCQGDQTKFWQCHNIPTGAVIYIRDLRVGQPTDQGWTNSIRVTAVQN